MSNKFDLSIFRMMLLSAEFENIASDLKKFDNYNCHFYYDESNNIRKLWLKEEGFNASVNSDFVLGGVMHMNDHCSADVNELKNQLRLQKSVKELKFKHISTGRNFLDSISEPKVHKFLHWLLQSDLYVHSSNVNNLYFAIVDIIDSIEEPSFIRFNFQLKNELYKIVLKKYNEFYLLLITFNYPNIAIESTSDFYQRLLDLIEDEDVMSFEVEILRQALKMGSKQYEVVFLQGYPEKTIIESYFHFYIRPIGLFSKAQHIFDNEYCIEEQFEKHEFYNGEHKVSNFSFVDSKENHLVQVSDCIIGLLGKFFTYVNQLEASEVPGIIMSLTPEQKSTLKLFTQIIKKSEDISKLLLHSTQSIKEHEVAAAIFYNTLTI